MTVQPQTVQNLLAKRCWEAKIEKNTTFRWTSKACLKYGPLYLLGCVDMNCSFCQQQMCQGAFIYFKITVSLLCRSVQGKQQGLKIGNQLCTHYNVIHFAHNIMVFMSIALCMYVEEHKIFPIRYVRLIRKNLENV